MVFHFKGSVCGVVIVALEAAFTTPPLRVSCDCHGVHGTSKTWIRWR